MITLGMALPHYDRLFPTDLDGTTTTLALSYARRAEEAGLHQLWVSDHLWVDVAVHDRRRSPDCWSLLAAIAATTQRIRIGSLVTPAPLRRPAQLLAQISAVLDLAPDRLDVGLGAGWQAQEFAACDLDLPTASERLASIDSSAALIRSTWREASPPICVGGKRSGILRTAGRVGDSWNLAWDPTPEDFTARLATVRRVAAAAGRPLGAPAAAVSMTTIIAENESHLRECWSRLCRWVPGGHLDGVPYEVWRRKGLIGTRNEVVERVEKWVDLGVDHIVCALGMPFGLFDDEQITLLGDVARRSTR